MRFLHTSDWHLGRQFHNRSLLPDQAHVLAQLTDLAVRESVDAVIVAGDIYDRAVAPAAAVSLLDGVVDDLCRKRGIPVIMIPGNHDSPERLGFAARQLGATGLHIIDRPEQILSPVVLEDADGPVAFYGVPYLEPAIARQVFEADLDSHDAVMAWVSEQIAEHRKARGNRRSVVLSHCFIAGGETSESERPLSVGGADQVSARHFRDFNYTALGHLHAPQTRGAETIRYSGSILKYSFSEVAHRKSVTLVDIDARGQCSIDTRELCPLNDTRIIEGTLEAILAQAAEDPAPEDYLQVRLTDTHAILDLMGKLRAVYPNVLHIERPGLVIDNSGQQVRRERLQQGELSMFEDFYTQVRGETMDAAQKALIEQTINRVLSDEG